MSMNKHVLLVYEENGSVEGIIVVDYEGSRKDLMDTINNTDTGEVYLSVEDILTLLDISYKSTEYLAYHPEEKVFISR